MCLQQKRKDDYCLNNISLPRKSSSQQVVEGMLKELSQRLLATQQDICPVDFTKAFTDMCLAQSCGKCVPCRTGLAKASEIIGKILDGNGSESDLALLKKTAEAAVLSADCAIGYHAGGIILESLTAFHDDYISHINKDWCSARADHEVPCSALCPAHVDIPGYIALVNAGRYADAVRLIRKDNPFPAVCGLICEHPCEAGCRRNMLDDAINIRGIKRYAVEKAGKVPADKPVESTGKKVAVVGAGPAGLTAAYYLSLMGHKVDVYEKRKEAGGMLLYGIPNYRLPKNILADEVASILETGNIDIHYNTDIGNDISIADLRKKADAVFVSIGAHSDRKLGIDGENLNGVMSAVKILRAIGDGEKPDFTGKKVAVIGGGNVAMDSARSSIRLGAEKVSIIYRRRQADMTALAEEVEGAMADGCTLVTMMAPARLEGDENGDVKAVVVKPQITGAVDRGRPSVSDADAPEERIEADIVIVAIGQSIESEKFGEFGLPLKRGTIASDKFCGFNNADGVFAGGDCASGPATVILAIAAGKTAARSIDNYLGFEHEISVDVEIPAASLKDKYLCGRVDMKERDASERRHDFSLMEICMSADEAKQESSRCLRCDKFGYGAFRKGRCTKW